MHCPHRTSPLLAAAILSLLWLTAGSGCGPDGLSDPVIEPPEEGWLALYGGSGGESMEGLLELPDGGFLAAGQVESFDGESADGLLVKLTPQGAVQWAKTYGGPDPDMLIEVQVADDGGLWAVGWTMSFGVDETDFWVLRLDAQGEVLWAKAYGGAGTEQAWSLAKTSDGGVAITGGTTSFGAGESDLWLLRLDAQGDILWESAYGGPRDEAGGGAYEEYTAHVVTSGDGNLVAGTGTLSFGAAGDLWLLKVDDASGEVLWEYSYGGDDEDANWSFSAMGDDGFLMTGSYTYAEPEWDADSWALRLNNDGSTRWQKTYGLPGRFDEVLQQTPTSDGGALLAAYYEVSDSDWRASLIKVADDGDLDWAQDYGPGALNWTNAVVQIDGGYLAIGVSTLDTIDYDEQFLAWRVDDTGAVGDGCTLESPLSLGQRDTSVPAQATEATVTVTAAVVVDTAVSAQPATLGGPGPCGR